MQRQYYMDNLRATLMLSGVLLHSALFLVPSAMLAGWSIRNCQTNSLFFYLVEFIHYWYMPLFYLLAGFFSHRIFLKRGRTAFVKNRLFRIGLPFLISFLLLSIYNIGSFIAYYKGGLPFNWHNLYMFLGFVGPLWFLYYLLFYYPLTLLCQSLFNRIFQKSISLPTPVLIGLFIGFVFFVLWICNSNLSFFPFSLTIDFAFFFSYFSFFLFGWIISLAPIRLEYINRWAWLMFLLGFFISFPSFIWLLQTHSNLKILQMLLNSISSWLLALSLLGMYYRWLNYYSSVLRYLANASYWFYLVQVPIILILQVYLSLFPIPMGFKLLYVYVIALTIMAITYALFVQKTFLGVLLNGERR